MDMIELRRRLHQMQDLLTMQAMMGTCTVSASPAPPPLTLDTLKDMMSEMRKIEQRSLPRVLVSQHLGGEDDGIFLVVNHDRLWQRAGLPFSAPLYVPWDTLVRPRQMVRLARAMRAKGWRPRRVWKRHGTALYTWESLRGGVA